MTFSSAVQPVSPVRVEQNFTGHFPVAEIQLHQTLKDETTFSFDGVGFVIQGSAKSNGSKDQVIAVDMTIDDRPAEAIELPTDFTSRRFTPFWKYELPDSKHTVRLKVRAPSAEASVALERAVVYGSKPVRPPV